MHWMDVLLEEPIRMASMLGPSKPSSFSAMTKIVGMLGPKLRSVDTISSCLKASMSVAQFNFSWGDAEYHQETLENLNLFGMNLEGAISDDIENLTELTVLDLSSNRGFGGTLTPSIGNLANLRILALIGCGFSGNVPSELGNLPQLDFPQDSATIEQAVQGYLPRPC